MTPPKLENTCKFCRHHGIFRINVRRWPGPPILRCPTCRTEYVEEKVGAEADCSTGELYDEFAAGQRGDRNWTVYTALAKKRLLWQFGMAFGQTDRREMRFLDIGCGCGYLIEAAQSLGVGQAVGVEIDAHAIASARSRGLRVYHGMWPIPDLTDTKYDFISLMHSLEHMQDPGGALESCIGSLKRGGAIAIDVPDQGSLPAALKRAARHTGRRVDHYAYLQPPWHIFAFRLRSFEVFARDHHLGFIWKRRTSPLDKKVFAHTDDYWSGRFRWNRRVYALTRMLGQGGHLAVGLRLVART